MSGPEPTFDDTFASVSEVEGWMTEGQAKLLWDSASQVPDGGTIVEIGSYHGRSAIVISKAARRGATVVAIDPHAGNDRGPQQIHGSETEGDRDNSAFRANLERAGVSDRVRHVRKPSQEALADLGQALDMVYVDGAHRYAPARDDIARWGERVKPGGRLLIHDSFSSVGVTLAQLRLLFGSRRFCYEGRSRSLAAYRRVDIAGPALARNAARQAAQLPWFARNVAVKVALTLRVRRVARVLGAEEWPY